MNHDQWMAEAMRLAINLDRITNERDEAIRVARCFLDVLVAEGMANRSREEAGCPWLKEEDYDDDKP